MNTFLFSKRIDRMNTHVFVVNAQTLKLHLEFMFAGTGAKNYNVDFNNKRVTKLPGKTENLLVGMIADANRIRKGDLIVFYLQQNKNAKIYEGKFFGTFQALQNGSFLDYNDSRQYLKRELGKSLTFRTLIKPYEVYSEGVTEWEALDAIENIKKPEQMLWSLIYRKLRANRGNTMITPYESDKICKLIKRKNNGRSLHGGKRLLTFDFTKQSIINTKSRQRTYEGRKVNINILPRLVERCQKKIQFEPHLQSYISRNLGMRHNRSLDLALLGEGHLEWFGNEVSCGVGMQRIDLLLKTSHGLKQTICPTELKSQKANGQTINQMWRYVDWVRQYYVPNYRGNLEIQPILVSKRIEKKTLRKDKLSKRYRNLFDSLISFNNYNKNICNNVIYVEFDVLKDSILFERVKY
jgi:predicted RNA-binding protein